MAKSDLTAARLRELLNYDPETGLFVWRIRPSKKIAAGVAAGCLDNGYIRIHIGQKTWMAHRLAWLHVHGTWPSADIDHINGNRSDNRIANLRDVSRSVNLQNKRHAQGASISGLLGAHWFSPTQAWYSRIMIGRKSHHLGYFKTAELAHAAYLDAKRRLHEGCTI